MQVDARTGFTQFCIGFWPLACRFQIPFKGLLAVLSRNIKVDHDVILRHLDVMQSARVQICQFCLYLFPFLSRRSGFIGILGRAVLANIIQNRVLNFEIDPRLCFFRNRRSKVRFLLELFCLETTVVAADTFTAVRVDTLLVIAEVVHKFFLEDSSGTHVRNVCARAEVLVHLPCNLQRNTVFLLEDIVTVLHEVVHIIGCTQHTDGNIIVIGMFVVLIDIPAIPRNGPQLEVDL